MPKQFKDLDQKAHDRFHERIKLFGMNAKDVPQSVTVGGGSGGSAAKDARPAGLHSRTIVVKNLAQLKALGGVPDEDFTQHGHSDRHLTYPEVQEHHTRRFAAAKGDANALRRLLTDEDHEMLGHAMRAYLLGNSTRVDRSLVEMIDKLEFPMEVTATAGENITVSGEWKLGQNGPETVQAGTITIEPTGYIVCVNKVNIDVGVLSRV